MKMSRYINIGGCPYHRNALLSNSPIKILAATETKLSIHHVVFNETKWIELDNDQLELAEKFEKALY